MGKDGAILVDAHIAFHAAAPTIKVHTTIGAGDAFLGALIAELVKQQPMQDALVTAVAAGSVVVSAPSKKIALQQVKRSGLDVTVETIY